MQHVQGSLGLLLIQVMKEHRRQAETLLGALGLHAGQEMILFRLWDADGLSQTQLAAHMDVEPPTITKMVSRMESSGLLRRQADPDDGRVSRVYLTERGRALEQPVLAAWAQLEAQTVERLTTREQAALRELLMQMHTNLSRKSEANFAPFCSDTLPSNENQ